jgi:hypothetical protein
MNEVQCELTNKCPHVCFHKEPHRHTNACKGICKNGPSVCVRANEKNTK